MDDWNDELGMPQAVYEDVRGAMESIFDAMVDNNEDLDEAVAAARAAAEAAIRELAARYAKEVTE